MICRKHKDNQKYDLERTLNKLYRCRDMEITNLWQRSIFLAVFLTLTLSGYGILASNFFSNNVFIELNYKILHGAAVAIGLLGFTLSVIWVLMAKGSKAWYEVYAKAISDFEEEFKHELGIPQIYLMGKVDFLDKDMEKKDDDGFYCNKKISNIDSGAYSVSKLIEYINRVGFPYHMECGDNITFISFYGFIIRVLELLLFIYLSK